MGYKYQRARTSRVGLVHEDHAFRVPCGQDIGDSIVEHVAGVDDFEVAEATYRAAMARWPAALTRAAPTRSVSPVLSICLWEEMWVQLKIGLKP
jgi:hypothetical protein